MTTIAATPLTTFHIVSALHKLPRRFLLFSVIMISCAFVAFPVSYLSATNLLMGILILPVALFTYSKSRFNILYFCISFFFAVISYKYNVRIFYFFSIAFFVLVVIEYHLGKCNQLILFNILFMSPFFFQVSTILGFPVRLALSKLAGNALQAIGLDVTIEGNLMQLNGSSFTVDDACMGLKMLSTSLLMGVFMLGVAYRRTKRILNFGPLLLFFTLVFGCNLICNLFRIVLLVIFNIGPEKSMHGVIGAACFLVYVMAPIYFIALWIVTRFGKERCQNKSSVQSGRFTNTLRGKTALSQCKLLLIAGLSFVIIVQAFHLRFAVTRIHSMGHFTNEMIGYQSTQLADGITQFKNDAALIYVKPIPEFFSGEHTPLICWKGSGYQFASVTEKHVHGRNIYIGRLVKNGSTLVTAWWYSNGEIITINQLDWRYRMLKGENDFSLVNATATDEKTLLKEISTWFDRRL